MEAIAKSMGVRVSPYKARLVVDQIRGQGVDQALQILTFSPKQIAKIIKDILRSAMANAENNFGMDVDTLIVSRATVDEGPSLKRFTARARGRSARIIKRTSHFTVGVESVAGAKKK